MIEKRKLWTEAETATLLMLYPTCSAKEIATVLGTRSVRQVETKAGSLGLRKTAEWIAERSRTNSQRPDHGRNTGRFVKGHATWNKGMKGLDIGGKETRFKPGARQGKAKENYKTVGYERISKDGYVQRKIHDGMPLHSRWRGVHLLTWEAAHGPIPRGHVVAFKDGDKSNVALENLALISQQDNMRRNSVHNYGPEISKVTQLRGAITRQVNRIAKRP